MPSRKRKLEKSGLAGDHGDQHKDEKRAKLTRSPSPPPRSSSSSSSSSSTSDNGTLKDADDDDDDGVKRCMCDKWCENAACHQRRLKMAFHAPNATGGTTKLCCRGDEAVEDGICPDCQDIADEDRELANQRVSSMSERLNAVRCISGMPVELAKMADSYTSSIAILWYVPFCKRSAPVPLTVYLSRAQAEASLRKHAGLEPHASLEPFMPVDCGVLRGALMERDIPTGYEYHAASKHRGGAIVLSADGELIPEVDDLCLQCGRSIGLHAKEPDKLYGVYMGGRYHIRYRFPRLTDDKVHSAFPEPFGYEAVVDEHDAPPATLVLVLHTGDEEHGCPIGEIWEDR